MNLEQALQWHEKNCSPEVVQRIRSRRVVQCLVDELNAALENIDESRSIILESKENERTAMFYLNSIRDALGFDGSFPDLIDHCKLLRKQNEQ